MPYIVVRRELDVNHLAPGEPVATVRVSTLVNVFGPTSLMAGPRRSRDFRLLLGWVESELE
jgi:hypothetical protein